METRGESSARLKEASEAPWSDEELEMDSNRTPRILLVDASFVVVVKQLFVVVIKQFSYAGRRINFLQ